VNIIIKSYPKENKMSFRDSRKLELVDKFKYPNGDIYEGEAYNKKVLGNKN